MDVLGVGVMLNTLSDAASFRSRHLSVLTLWQSLIEIESLNSGSTEGVIADLETYRGCERTFKITLN